MPDSEGMKTGNSSQGMDPGAVRNAQKVTGKIQAEQSLEVVAREWQAGNLPPRCQAMPTR